MFQTIPDISLFDHRICFFGDFIGTENQFFVNLVRFSRSYSEMDLKISFCVKFCYRYAFPKVCTTENAWILMPCSFMLPPETCNKWHAAMCKHVW